MTRRGLLALVVLLVAWAAPARAQTYTLHGSELVVTALPSRAGETDCLWVDAGGRAKRGACATAGTAAVAANLIFGGPTSGGSALPTFRSLVDADIPNDLTLGTVGGTPTFTGAATFNSTVQADISLGAISGRRRWQSNGLGLAALAADNGWAAVATGPLSVTGTGAVSGDLSVGGVSSSLVPSLTDTYNLGSATRLWNEGFLAQLNAVLFAEQTATLFGGWSVIGKNAGTFPARVASSATTIDFGKTMSAGHFIVIRAHDEGGSLPTAEHLQVGSLVSGTTYNVTRNLSGLGAKTWPAGTSYLVSGTTGDGRIELRAYSTPQISILTQGAAYNAQTEQVRIGYLDGMPGMAAGKIGLYIGDLASSGLAYYDGALQIRGSVTVTGGNAATTSYADGVAATAQSTAISTASGDATTKANTAYSNAVSWATTNRADTSLTNVLDATVRAKTAWGHASNATLIDGGDIYTGSIFANAIAANTITADKLNVSQLSAISANLGTVTAGTITGATIQTATSGTARLVLDGTSFRSLTAADATLAEFTGTTGLRFYAAGTDAPVDRSIRWMDSDAYSYGTIGYLDSTNTLQISANGTVRIGGNDSAGSVPLIWGGSTSVAPSPTAHLKFAGGSSGGVAFSTTNAGNGTGVEAWRSFKPAVDSVGVLGHASYRWENIHLNLPFGASTSLTYVLVNDPTDVSRLYAFTGGLDGTTTCGTGQSVYQVTVEKGLVTSVGCR